MSFSSRAVVLALSALAACLLPLAALAQVPALINYQGRLVSGTNLVNGNVGLSLRLFNLASGGSKLYEDSNTVTVADGLYSTFIGDNTTSGNLGAVLAVQTQLWVEVAINNVALSPRERVASVAYAGIASAVPPDAIATAMIADGAVTGSKLANGAVAGDKIVGGAISNAHLSAEVDAMFLHATGGTVSGALTVAGHVLPGISNTFSLGSSSQTWAALHLGSRITYFPELAFSRLGVTNLVLSSAGNLTVDGTVTAAAFAGSGYNLTGIAGSSIAFGTITANALGSGAVTSNKIASNAVTTAALADGSVTSSKIASDAIDSSSIRDGSLTANDFEQVAKHGRAQFIPNPTPGSNAFFGASVCAMGSNRFVVGAPGYDAGVFDDAGNAYLFDADGALIISLTNRTMGIGDNFGHSVGSVGSNRFVVGAPFAYGGATQSGAAYLYDFDGTYLLSINNPSPASFDRFGGCVAGVGTNRFVVGASSDDGDALNAGRAYLYNSNGVLILTITNPAPAVGDGFGGSAAPVGVSRFVLGAGADDHEAFNAGRVYLYGINGNFIATVTNPAPEALDEFGGAVAGVGPDRFVVGAYGDTVGALTNAGSAYLYNSNGGLLATIPNPEPAANDYFGISVAGVGSNRFLVGAYMDAEDGIRTGCAYLYDYDGTLLEKLPGPSTPGARFGRAVTALGPSRFVIGADGSYPGSLTNAGSVYLFDDSSIEHVVTGFIAVAVARYSVGVDQLDTVSVDARYVLKTGDTMTGPLTAPGFVGDGSGLTNVTPADGSVSLAQLNTSSVDIRYIRRAGDTLSGALHIESGSAGAVTAVANSIGIFESSGNSYVSLLAPTGSVEGIVFGTEADNNDSGIYYNIGNSRDIRIRTGNNNARMTISASGNVGIGTINPTGLLHVAGNAYANAWLTTSDRNAKQDIAPVDAASILEKISALPLASWSFKTEPDVKHIGPMAQDFRAAFGLGPNDTSIATVDADGVALAAIQALKQENDSLKKQLDDLRSRLDALEKK